MRQDAQKEAQISTPVSLKDFVTDFKETASLYRVLHCNEQHCQSQLRGFANTRTCNTLSLGSARLAALQVQRCHKTACRTPDVDYDHAVAHNRREAQCITTVHKRTEQHVKLHVP